MKTLSDTRTFRTIVSIRGAIKTFWGFNHHRRAVEWLHTFKLAVKNPTNPWEVADSY